MKELTDYNFNSEIKIGLILVDFWAPWCGPCNTMAPVLESMAENLKGIASIAKVNVDENPTTAIEQNIKSIPALLLFKNGVLVDTKIGAGVPQAILEEWVKSHV